VPEDFDRAFWEDHYRGHDGHGERAPSPQLVAEAEGLAPGIALDAGCGDGTDALWLAGRGWQVTAVDVSETALRRAQERADSLDPRAGRRVDWVQADLTAGLGPERRFDLVSSQYVHLPDSTPQQIVGALAPAVAVGGTLLVVGHDRSDHVFAAEHGTASQLYLDPAEAARTLAPDEWEVGFAGTRPPTGTHAGGEAVLLARRVR
jgi:SAM-dependent methyltransferase